MADDKIGLMESISMAVGGMVGGGIFAALGIVAVTADTLAWLAFIVAGIIALCAGYSFIQLNSLIDGHAGPMTYVKQLSVLPMDPAYWCATPTLWSPFLRTSTSSKISIASVVIQGTS